MYKPKLFKPQHIPAIVLRFAHYVLGHWPLAVIAAFMLSPAGPHVRIQYTYTQTPSGARSYVACDYLGSRGLVSATFGGRCPMVAIIDARRPK